MIDNNAIILLIILIPSRLLRYNVNGKANSPYWSVYILLSISWENLFKHQDLYLW